MMNVSPPRYIHSAAASTGANRPSGLSAYPAIAAGSSYPSTYQQQQQHYYPSGSSYYPATAASHPTTISAPATTTAVYTSPSVYPPVPSYGLSSTYPSSYQPATTTGGAGRLLGSEENYGGGVVTDDRSSNVVVSAAVRPGYYTAPVGITPTALSNGFYGSPPRRLSAGGANTAAAGMQPAAQHYAAAVAPQYRQSSPLHPGVVGEHLSAASPAPSGLVSRGIPANASAERGQPSFPQNAAPPRKTKMTVRYHGRGCCGSCNSNGCYDRPGGACGLFNCRGCCDRERITYKRSGSAQSFEAPRR